ncbi:MAG: DegT/DnrJ/EryC1/StrS family aminotransferase [Melioribacteraceae bacterium]|nr:DegT/DnrJ/EryC1/StrS family aminotransferase [Melioribacteraceae bacterium]
MRGSSLNLPFEAKLDNKITVTKPSLPPLEEFIPYLESIWKSQNLTNNGEFHKQLEKELAEYLGVKYLSLFTNGTLALLTALQTLKISGEVITTPYSFVATTHSLHWNGIKPVFVDIEPNYCNLDAEKIEAAITPQTTAILPVHVYGNPCNVDKIKEIADNYGLKVIYDACHAFGVKINNNSVLNYGDLSILSFHATKVFTTFEGGAIVCHDETTKRRIDFLKNFGFANETTVVGPGINAKMNEFQAALGVLQLKYVDKAISERRRIVELYRKELAGLDGVRFMDDIEGVTHNYPYFPIFIDNEKFGKTRDEVYEKLKENNIYARRYFYPLISQFPTYRGLESAKSENLPTAERIAEEVLCLPVYSNLQIDDVMRISRFIVDFAR